MWPAPGDPLRLTAALLMTLTLAGCGGEEGAAPTQKKARRAPAVEVAPITQGTLTARRVLSGGLEASAEITLTSRVAGVMAEVSVQLGDVVEAGAVVARIHDEALGQQMAEAKAAVAVAGARHRGAKSAAAQAARALKRAKALHARGIAADAALDEATAAEANADAAEALAAAELQQARAALSGAEIELGYAALTAEAAPGLRLVVATRHVDPGAYVSPGDPVVSLVALDPIVGVIHVTEADHRHVQVGQRAQITTDGWPGIRFEGQLARIAPIFAADSRQSRVEVRLPNPDGRLKPGMFIQATVETEQAEGATQVPLAAITRRDDAVGVFLIEGAGAGAVARWRPVTVGLEAGERVQISSADGPLSGQVVTLGQQLIEDGAQVRIVEAAQ